MTLSQSKLMIQLSKQQKLTQRSNFNEQYLEDIYSTICKLEPKNLMLSEFLALVIQKQLIKNSNKLIFFVELFEEVKGKNFDQEQNHINKSNTEMEEQKFSKKKFLKLLKDLAKRLFPGHQNPYETVLFDKITTTYSDQHRIKMDDTLKKYLTRDTIDTLNEYESELEHVFQIYMPENYNQSLEFNWQQIKVLEKKLPILCCLRFFYEIELVPHFLTGLQFLQFVSKLKPPALPNSNNSKQTMFYTSDTITTYMRDYISLPQIKLLQGDVGLSFLQFQFLFIRIATEFSKDPKNDFSNNIKKLMNYGKIKQAFNEANNSINKFHESVKSHLKAHHSNTQKNATKKRDSRKQIEDLYDSKDKQLKQETAKYEFRNISINSAEIEMIKKDLDFQLGEFPYKKKIEKQNNGFFDVDQKHIVIGEQLPKIQQKNKPIQKQNKKKNEDILLGYKPQVAKNIEQSATTKMIKRAKKMRINTEYPIILNEVFYPSNIKSTLSIPSKAEVFLETSYIHLGERLYEEAFLTYTKAKNLSDLKSISTEFFFYVHAAQIFESAGRDEIALSFYFKAKQIINSLSQTEIDARAYPYIGLGACLYHLEQYNYALRCFQKAKNIYGINLQVQSIQNAILLNNIGSCLMMLNRNQQAVKYFQISHNILDLKLGRFDERSLVVQQNGAKNRKAYLQMMPQFRTMWKTYIQKSKTKLPNVKKAGTNKK